MNQLTRPAAQNPSTNFAMVTTDQIEMYTREELQRYIAGTVVAMGLPGSAIKATRVARAMMRLAAMAEQATGYTEEAFTHFATRAFRQEANRTGYEGTKEARLLPIPPKTPRKAAQVGSGVGGPALGAKKVTYPAAAPIMAVKVLAKLEGQQAPPAPHPKG